MYLAPLHTNASIPKSQTLREIFSPRNEDCQRVHGECDVNSWLEMQIFGNNWRSDTRSAPKSLNPNKGSIFRITFVAR